VSLLLLLFACLDHDPIPGGEEQFVAMQNDFSGFTGWPDYAIEPEDSGHPEGARTVYISEEPPEGATAFPVGTMIVKVIEGADIHAMAKRGGGFNAEGALGWEWFELVMDGSEPVIRWRGAEPPDGETYGALPGVEEDSAAPLGNCDSCHSAVSANDFVHVVGL
jgi:hypothetical protein